MKNLIIRALTGAVYVLLLVGCTVYSPVTAFIFFGLVAAATVTEYCHVMNRHAGASLVTPLCALVAMLLVAAVWLMSVASPSASRMTALWGLLLIILFVGELFRRAEDPLRNWSLTALSQVYIALPFSLLPLLCVSTNAATGQPAYDYVRPLCLFIFLWVNDTGAYLSGLGLHGFIPAKLFERVSPKKSWEGFWGGAVCALLLSLLLSHWLETLPLSGWLIVAVLVVVFGVFGDLFESMLKRHLGLKDSGHFMPGHGGMLDRFDAVLVSFPMVWLYLMIR